MTVHRVEEALALLQTAADLLQLGVGNHVPGLPRKGERPGDEPPLLFGEPCPRENLIERNVDSAPADCIEGGPLIQMKEGNPQGIARAAQVPADEGKLQRFAKEKRGPGHQIPVPRQKIEPLLPTFQGMVEKPQGKFSQGRRQYILADGRHRVVPCGG